MNVVEAQAQLAALEGTKAGKKKFAQALEPFMVAVRKMEVEQPEAFQEWYAENKEWGLRYDAQMATGRHFVGDHPMAPEDTKMYGQRAEATGMAMGREAGFGEDGKQDGKAYQSRYGTKWNDVNNESGPGDFFKLGTPGAMKGGFLDFIEDNPTQVAAMVASMAMPWLAPHVATALGVTSAAGQAAVAGALTGGTQLLGGADPETALISALTAGTMDYLNNAGSLVNAGGAVNTPTNLLDPINTAQTLNSTAQVGLEGINSAAQVINSTLGTSFTPQQMVDLGIATVSGNGPEAALKLAIPELSDAAWESVPELRSTLENNGWSTDAIDQAVTKYVTSGGDTKDAVVKWVKEGGVGDIPLPDTDLNLNLGEWEKPDWFNPQQWTDPIEEAVSKVDLGNWGGSESINIPNIETPNWGGSESIDIPETQALQWPEVEAPSLPEMPGVPEIPLPEIPKPDIEADFDLSSLLPLAPLLIPLLGGKDNDGQKKFDVSGIPTPTSPQPNVQLPNYGTVQQAPLFGQPSRDLPDPTRPLLWTDEDEERRGLL